MPIQALLLEDNPDDVELLRMHLSPSDDVKLRVTDTLEAALDSVKQSNFDIALLDLSVPDSQGLSTFLEVQKYSPATAIVILTGLDGDKIASEAIQQGAQDFVTKEDLTPRLLQRVIRYAIERKRAEHAFKVAHQELKKAHHELKITQAQLIQVEKMESVGRLAAGMAHEVMNPLSIILQGVTYLEAEEESDSCDKETQREVISYMRESVVRAQHIVKSLLDFSRPSRIELCLERIEVLLDEALCLVERQMVFKQITLEKEIEKDLPQVYFDKNQMVQVLINLIANAYQAMDRKGRLILHAYPHTITEQDQTNNHELKECFEVDQRTVVIAVEDSGPGMDEERLAKIWDPFFTTKAPGQGTGLGLSVVRTIISAHHGTITVKSKPGYGTTFSVYLPIA